MKGSSMSEELAVALHKEFSGEEDQFVGTSSRNEAHLLVIDRRMDLVTPILNQV